ncbi:RNase adapter RapZ [Thiovibrio frasassiensis]|uniref:RNase adapter RapZ n=1 Tax=Thiovibrio frasassiensis TaxID=2984131 RepID=A0A9X4MN16_9BACT|nr:RNase adapter RapZ [Thiovibrio frasassiensis]MDG4475667.1 RNase adapter RapZ [Thiovibrio frasassiensis]
MSEPAIPPLTLTIITGLSGAGKSTALNVFEDAGFLCIDNLPVFLLLPLLDGMARKADGPHRLALVMDARDAELAPALAGVLKEVKPKVTLAQIVFLEANDTVLLRRYSQLRRAHPLAQVGLVQDGIASEKTRLAGLRHLADRVIDTSNLTPTELRHKLLQHDASPVADMRVNILSFGHKHGLPSEADLLFDVRFLPNPYYVAELKEKTGRDAAVAAHALANESGRKFFAHLSGLLDFLLPEFEQAGKAYLTIAVGCTGGKHRSVAVAEEVHRHLAGGKWVVKLFHRDLDK